MNTIVIIDFAGLHSFSLDMEALLIEALNKETILDPEDMVHFNHLQGDANSHEKKEAALIRISSNDKNSIDFFNKLFKILPFELPKNHEVLVVSQLLQPAVMSLKPRSSPVVGTESSNAAM